MNIPRRKWPAGRRDWWDIVVVVRLSGEWGSVLVSLVARPWRSPACCSPASRISSRTPGCVSGSARARPPSRWRSAGPGTRRRPAPAACRWGRRWSGSVEGGSWGRWSGYRRTPAAVNIDHEMNVGCKAPAKKSLFQKQQNSTVVLSLPLLTLCRALWRLLLPYGYSYKASARPG